ncbi:hypothetical protein [Clostridium tertium]|uniref:hypothetical protein n=1 Tax=Clostridium tertium TaxID=1559 RepID=UPI0023B2242F|nr:hypothetical protein [Clostridium tertium]
MKSIVIIGNGYGTSSIMKSIQEFSIIEHTDIVHVNEGLSNIDIEDVLKEINMKIYNEEEILINKHKKKGKTLKKWERTKFYQK